MTNSAKFDLLDVELGLDKQDVKVFGGDAEKLATLYQRLKDAMKFPGLDSLNLPLTDKLNMVDDLVRREEYLQHLQEVDEGKLASDAERQAHRRAIEDARRKCEQLVARMGLSEDEVKSLIQSFKAIRGEVNPEPKESTTDGVQQ